jgi:hypothetical protein
MDIFALIRQLTCHKNSSWDQYELFFVGVNESLALPSFRFAAIRGQFLGSALKTTFTQELQTGFAVLNMHTE